MFFDLYRTPKSMTPYAQSSVYHPVSLCKWSSFFVPRTESDYHRYSI